MNAENFYLVLANVTMVAHLLLVVFVVGGLVVIVAGNLRGWRWVNARWFRFIHLATIGIVVAEVALGFTCPLTTLEMWLRGQAGAVVHDMGFIEYWVGRLLYYQAPPWIFGTAYVAFGLLVLLTWKIFPPARRGAHD